MIDLIIVDVMTPQILISSYINAVLKFQVKFPEKGYEVGKSSKNLTQRGMDHMTMSHIE